MIAGLFIGLRKQFKGFRDLFRGEPGWLWFTTVPKKAGVARIGITVHDPEPLLPEDVKLMYKTMVPSRSDALVEIDRALGKAHVKQAFYDKEAVKAYISHLKGEW